MVLGGSSSARCGARAELWRTILLESLLLLGVGCLTGPIFGLYGQQLLDRALATVICRFDVAAAFRAQFCDVVFIGCVAAERRAITPRP
jgi:hypothetical protein